MSATYGTFERAGPLPHWGGGFFVGKRADGRAILHLGFDEDAAPLAREGDWRAAHPHPNLPEVLRHGRSTGVGWIAYAPVVAVRFEQAIAVHPVPIVLAWVQELVAVMEHHARFTEAAAALALLPSLADLLLTSEGRLLVLSTPAVGRTWRTQLLRHSFHQRALAPTEPIDQSDPSVSHDVFTAGALLRHALRERKDEPRGDVPLRVRQLVARALGPVAERHESLAELVIELRGCLDEFPPLEASERASAVVAIARDELERARGSLA